MNRYVVKQILKNVKFKIIGKQIYYFLSLFHNSRCKIKKKNFLIALMTYVNQFFVEDSVMISIIV